MPLIHYQILHNTLYQANGMQATYVIVVVNGEERRVDAGTCTLNLAKSEHAVLGGLADLVLQASLSDHQ